MFVAFDQFSGAVLSDFGNQLLLDAALDYFTTFLLVLIRLSGLMVVGPFFGHSAIPMRVKILLAMSLALIITPALPHLRDRGFEQLDINNNGELAAGEIPRGVLESGTFESQSAESVTISAGQFRTMQQTPSTMFDLLWLAGTELLIGMMLGFGVLIVLSGLQMAGETFDQQAGTALSEIFNPALGTSSSPAGQLLFMLGTTVLLVMLPYDGHLMMLMSLIRTFEVLPVGMAWVDVTTLDVLRGLLSQSLIIAIQIAAPLLAAMALLSVAMGFLGFTVPQINVLVLGFPIRAMLATGILVITLSGASESIIQTFSQVLDKLTESMLEAGQTQ